MLQLLINGFPLLSWNLKYKQNQDKFDQRSKNWKVLPYFKQLTWNIRHKCINCTEMVQNSAFRYNYGRWNEIKIYWDVELN